MSVWINSAQIFFANDIWGSAISRIFVTSAAVDFFCFVSLVFAAVTNQSIRFKPSPFLCYVVMAWACMATAVLIECEPSTWASKMTHVENSFVADDRDLTKWFLDTTGCKLEDTENCWEMLRSLVDKKFIVFAQCFVVLYPLMLGTGIVYVVTA